MHNNSIWKSFLACFTHLDNCPPYVEEGDTTGCSTAQAWTRRCLSVCPSHPFLDYAIVVGKPKNKNLIFSTKRYASLACVTATHWGRRREHWGGNWFPAHSSHSSLLVALRRCRQALMSCSIRFGIVVIVELSICQILAGPSCSTLAMIKMFVLLQCRHGSFPHFPPPPAHSIEENV